MTTCNASVIYLRKGFSMRRDLNLMKYKHHVRSTGFTRRFRFGESSDNVAQLSELLAERRFRTQVALNEIAENENYRFLSRTITRVGTTNQLTK